MLKKLKWLFVVGVIGVIAIMGTNVFATESLTHYEPYSSWSKDVGFEHSLIFLDKPQRPALRWEIVNLLDNISDIKGNENISNDIEFTDLDELSDGIRQKIIKAIKNGYISGYEDKTFRPFNEVSRGEFVALLDRFGMLEKSKKSSSKKFLDVQEHWSKDYVYKAVASGIINGKGEDTFCPDDTITLEEILVILDRMENSNQITEEELINCILDTFPSRQYGESEKFMVEDIYGEMEQIQHDMWVYRNSLLEYDFNDIGRTLTLDDVLYWDYYYYNRANIEKFSVDRLKVNESSKARIFLDLCKNKNYISGTDYDKYFYGITSDKDIDYSKNVTVKEFLHPLMLYNTTDCSDVEVNFSNFSTFSEEEKKDIRRAVYFELIPNTSNEFPIDSYMTGALLNYITVKRNQCKQLYKNGPIDIFTNSYYFNEYASSEAGTYHVEMDENTWPSNYEQYPFIMRPIPNEAYEIPFIGMEAEKSMTPIQLFEQGRFPYKNYGLRYINTVLNIDYETISKEKLYEEFSNSSLDIYTPHVENYIDYVKKHKIKLEGSCSACLPIAYYDASDFGRTRMRFYVQFKILSSDTNVNILFDDSKGIYYEADGQNDVLYDGNEFEFYIDLIHVKYGYDPRVECSNPFVESIVMQKKGSITKF